MALSRMLKEGELTRLSKGVYCRPLQSGRGTAASSSAAARGLRTAVHPAGLSAAGVLGFTARSPALPEYATAASMPPRSLRAAKVYARRPAARRGLSEEEGALLEFLRDRGETSDLPTAATVERLCALLVDRRRFARLVAAAEPEPARVRAMLGAIGEGLGADPELLARLRSGLSPLSRYDFGSLQALPLAAKWQAARP